MNSNRRNLYNIGKIDTSPYEIKLRCKSQNRTWTVLCTDESGNKFESTHQFDSEEEFKDDIYVNFIIKKLWELMLMDMKLNKTEKTKTEKD